MTIEAFIFSCVAVLIASAVCTHLYLRYARHKGIIDKPNHRSSHETPTPRGGGLVIAALTLILWSIAIANQILTIQQGCALIIPGILISVISYLDDHGHVLRRIRFSVQIIAAGIGIALLYPLTELPLTANYSINFNSLLIPIALLVLIWLTNLYNFMDGIDGIAASQAVAVLLPAALALHFAGETNFAMLLSIFACIVLGFLTLNWPPAKLFMGDIGSTFIGLTLGLIALLTAEILSYWFWIIILGCFIGDASWTLLTRILTRQRWKEGHRLHAYQKMTSSNEQHNTTTLIYISMTLFWLAPLAILVSKNHSAAIFLSTIAYMPIICICIKFNSGKDTN